MLLISLYCTAKVTRSIKACERKITVTLWSSVQHRERERKKKRKERNLDYLMKAAWQVVPDFTVGDEVKTKRVKLSLEQLVILSYLKARACSFMFFFFPLPCSLVSSPLPLLSHLQPSGLCSSAGTASAAKAATICCLYVSHTFRLRRARGCTAHAYTYMTHILRYLSPLSHDQNWNINWRNGRNVDMHAL